MSENILKSSFFVLILIFAGKLLSFLRDIIISSQFGSTYQSDAYFAANNIPSLLFTAILASYIVLLIPFYKKLQLKSGETEANLFASRVLNFFIIISVVLSILGFIFSESLIHLVAPGFDEKTHYLAVILVKILLLSFPFSSATIVLATISNANNKYYAPHIIPLFSSLFVIIGIVIFAETYGIIVLAVSGVLAFVFQLVIQIIISRKHFKYTFKVNFLDKNLKKMSFLVLPIFLGYSIDQINLLVNSIICSNLTAGSLSSLNYAQRLQATINGTLSTALITVIYPIFSKLSSENNFEKLTEMIKNSLKGLTLILLPVVIFLTINSISLISIVYFRGKFDMNALKQTSSIFFFYSFNILLIALREFILRIYYIMNNTNLPFIASIISISINIFFSILFIKYLDVSGLALANFLATIISMCILFIYIPIKTEINISFFSGFSFLKTILFPLSIFITIQILQNKYFEIGSNIFLFIFYFSISVLQYFILLIIFKQKEALNALKIIKIILHI